MRRMLLAVVLATACGGPAASPTPTASSAPSPSAPAASATPSAVASVVRPSVSPTTVPLPNFVQLSAPSREVAWSLVAGSLLFRSTDHGDTWQQRPTLAPPNPEISFADDHDGWLSSRGSPATQCQSQAIVVWRTTDGGTTWTELAPSGIADAQCKEALSFTDASHGFVGAWDPNHAPVIYRTADAGGTWSASTPLPDPPGLTTSPGGQALRAGRVRAFGATLLVPAGAPDGGAARTFVFRSADGGATWTYLATAPADGTLAFVTASRWISIGIPGGSKETTDAGATWHAYTSDYSQAAPIAPEIVFGDADVGYATVRGGIQRTTDGGARWKSIRTPGTAP